MGSPVCTLFGAATFVAIQAVVTVPSLGFATAPAFLPSAGAGLTVMSGCYLMINGMPRKSQPMAANGGSGASSAGKDDALQGQPADPGQLPPENENSTPKAKERLARKLKALEKAERNAVQKEILPDGRIRYYAAETAARTPGQTRGASLVTEYNPKTGDVRVWMESYDHSGNVIRVHPKMINGELLESPHFPPTGSEVSP